MVRQNPGEITLLTIGPLTNAALLFKLDPQIPSLLKGLVMMAGVFRPGGGRPGLAEWNVMCDPHAAAIVYASPVAVHRSVGLDVTTQVTMQAPEVKRRFRRGLLRAVLDFAQVWFRHSRVLTFHDPLAATTIFDSRICGFERGRVAVDLVSSLAPGMTVFGSDTKHGEHEIAATVNRERFLKQYFSVF
jgi:inosine-uridine nucleoside N-ribohydrolase